MEKSARNPLLFRADGYGPFFYCGGRWKDAQYADGLSAEGTDVRLFCGKRRCALIPDIPSGRRKRASGFGNTE